MEKEGTYNGYTNYETWAVALWMDNDQGSYAHYRGLAREAQLENDFQNQSDCQRQAITIEIAARLRKEFEEASPVASDATVFADLMNAALSEVNWHELADNLLKDIKEEDNK